MVNEYDEKRHSVLLNSDHAEHPHPVTSVEQRVATFVGKKYATYYKQKFSELNMAKPNMSFHYGALFFSFLWLFYRKMYGHGILVLSIVVAILLLNYYVMDLPSLSTFIVSLIVGFKANAWYASFVNKKIQIIEATYHQPHQIDQALLQQGGVNLFLALGCGIVIMGFLLFALIFLT